MLLTQEVLIKLNGNNANRLENLGYFIPKRTNSAKHLVYALGEKIKIKTKDLSSGSDMIVHCSCDYEGCTNISEMKYNTYLKHNHDGKTYCHKHANKILNSGENSVHWKPNKTVEEREIGRYYYEYHEFIKKVLARDKYTCQICGKTNKDTKIVVHHLDNYADFLDKRTDETNGICLCHSCHHNYHNTMGVSGATKEKFVKWCDDLPLNLEKYDGKIQSCKWAYCIEDDEIIKNIVEYSIQHNLSYVGIYECCNNNIAHHKCKHYIWYENYINMSEYEVLEYLINRLHIANYNPVICLNNKKCFLYIKEANKYANVKSSVQQCCSNRAKHAGKDPIANEKLSWKYLYKYLIENNCSIDEYREIFMKTYRKEV